jgi:ADP-heptose:LPS heptosyltransferase
MNSPQPHEPIRLILPPPPDRMLGDRLRAAVRAVWLGLRAAALAPLLLRRWRVPPSPGRVNRILVVRTDRLGDMALTTAALADLKTHFRRAAITVLAPPAPLALLEGHPAVDRLVPLAGRRLPPGLAGRFDLAVDFTPDATLRGARLVAAAKAPLAIGMRAAGRQAFFTLRGPRADPSRHILDLNRQLVEALGIEGRAAAPALHVSAEERGVALNRLAALGAASPRIVVHPGGHFASQRWAAERFAEVITLLTGRLGAACVVVAGPGEEALVRRICAATPDALDAGPQTVRGLMALCAACDLFIGNNSGPLHVAGALGIPTVSVSGPTDMARFAPRGPADRVVRRDLPCSPCNRGRCWHHTCLRSLEPEEVASLAQESLAALLPREAAR